MTGTAQGQGILQRIVEQEYFEIQLRSDGIVWLVRRSNPYASVAAIHAAYDQLLTTIDDWLIDPRLASGMLGTRRQTPMAWLFDVRAVSNYRNDEEFEQAVKKRQPDLVKRSPVMAVLVRTATGRMQMNRLRQAADQGEPEVFDDDAAAIQWLLRKLNRLTLAGSPPQ